MNRDSKKLLVVTGTQREGALAAGPGVTVLAGGGDGARLADELARAAPCACGIISFGTGGGLVPGLDLGDMVIGDRLTGALTRDCDAAWVEALSHALPQARIGAVFADGMLLSSADQKRRAAATGAIVADMESHLAMAAAVRHDVPFAVLRCVSDTAEAVLPPAIAVAMRADGGLALTAVLGSILRQPWQLPALIGTGMAFGKSFAQLKAATLAVGLRATFDQRQASAPGTGHPDTRMA